MPEKTREEILEESKAKSEFLSMVTHQLRTPLSGLKWIFQMLLAGDLGSFNAEQKNIIQKGSESTERMISLLQEVITANQNNEWDFKYEFQKTDLGKIIESIITEFLEEARVNNVTIRFERPDQPLPLVNADPEKMMLVFQNLIENAIKYSDSGSAVVIRTHVEDASLVFSFQDHGIGIPKEEQSKIFQKFFRAENARERKKEGTGLGLFTAQNIIEKHGGTLTFESVPNKGTTFYCKLPLFSV